MSASLAPQWIFQALTDAGAVASGAKLYSYIAGGGSVPSPLLGEDGVTPLANPYTFNSAGRAKFLLDDAVSYRLRLETATGALIEERDNVFSAKSAFNGWVRATDLADGVNPANGAGMVGYEGITVRTALKSQDGNSVPLLRYIPTADWAQIQATSGSIYVADDAIDEAFEDLRAGTVLQLPAGRIAGARTHAINKPFSIEGAGPDLGASGTLVMRSSSLDAPLFVLGGGEADDDLFISGINIRKITFTEGRSFVVGGALKTAHFMHINCLAKSSMRDVYFAGDMIGAWMYFRRTQDMSFDNMFFRGGGSDLGPYAQVLIGDPQDSQETANHPVNELVFGSYSHWEWGPNFGNVYIDPATGLSSSASRGSVAIKSDQPNVAATANSCRWDNAKFEMTTGRNWDGESLRKAAFYLRNSPMFQFHACEFNQTSWQFDVENCKALEVHGKGFYGGGQGAADNRRKFGKWVNSDQLTVDVQFSYNGPSRGPIINCPGHRVYVDSAIGTVGAPIPAMERKAEFGDLYKSAMFKSVSGSSIVQDIRGTGREAIVSREIASEADYSTPLLALRPTNTKVRPNGMTLKVLACLDNAPVGAQGMNFEWYWSPGDTVYYNETDGVRINWPVPMFFAPDTDGVSVPNPVTAWKRNKTTGVETAVTIVTKYGEGDWNGGSVDLAEAVPATHEVIIRRQAYGKGIINTNTLSTTPVWYIAYIPPNVLRLDNVFVRVTAMGNWAAGTYYRILDWDYADDAECPTIPYYPMTTAGSGPGLPPNGNGWTTAQSIIKCSRPGTQNGLYFKCVGASTNNGAGSWEMLTPSAITFRNTGTTNYTTLDPATIVVGVKARYINDGSTTITITAFAGTTFAKCNQTVLSLGVGESVLLEYTAASVWSIVDGLVSMAEIVFTGDVGQSIATATTAKVTAFNVNASASINCTADQANDKLTTTREGLYQIDARLSWYTNVITNYTVSIFVDGVLAGVSAVEYFGATGSATSQVETISFSTRTRIAAGKDVDLRIAHSDGGSVNVGVVRASLSAKRIA